MVTASVKVPSCRFQSLPMVDAQRLQRRDTWTVLDQRSGQTFPWRLQTRAFKADVVLASAHQAWRSPLVIEVQRMQAHEF